MGIYRIDIHIRRQGQAPFDFAEFKSELANDLQSLCYEDIASFIEQCITEDLEGAEDVPANIVHGL